MHTLVCRSLEALYYIYGWYLLVFPGSLLLKDAQGNKSGSLLAFRKKRDVAVLRGSLLVALSPKDATSGADGKPAHNYGVHNEDITLYCSEEDIAPLTNYEFKLLCGTSTLGT